MKFPSSHPNISGYGPPKQKRALDIAAPKKSVLVRMPVRDMRAIERSPAILKKRDLDGVQREKHTFLTQLRGRSLRDVSWRIFRKGEIYFRLVRRLVSRCIPDIAPHKLLYGSLVGGVAFGMVSMAFMEHFFGPGVFARSENSGQVAGVSTTGAAGQESADMKQTDYNSETDIFFEYFNETTDAEYKETVQKMVKGYPIEGMLPYIFEQDRLTSAFLIGIAKKESNWGKRVPVLNGQDCFNYWGYRGVRRLMGTGGHTCFNSSKDAVDTVAKRLSTLIHSEKLDTPEKMIIWKCGFSCSGHSRESVKKWISDVDMYFSQLSDE